MSDENLNALLAIAIAALAPILIALARKVTRHLESALGIQLDEQQRKQIDWAAATAVQLIEEEARRRLRSGDTPIHGQTKLQLAKARVRELAPDATGIVADDRLEGVIEAHVHRARASMPPPGMFRADD